jgi:hypothetical protein
MTECVDEIKTVTTGARLVQLIKENRLEAMIVTILLYSTGLLDKAIVYGSGVC